MEKPSRIKKKQRRRNKRKGKRKKAHAREIGKEEEDDDVEEEGEKQRKANKCDPRSARSDVTLVGSLQSIRRGKESVNPGSQRKGNSDSTSTVPSTARRNGWSESISNPRKSSAAGDCPIGTPDFNATLDGESLQAI